MSHFALLVVGENVAEQLAPFQENNMGDCPEQYLAFVEDEDSSVDERTGKRGYWENPNRKWDWWVADHRSRYHGRLWKKGSGEGHDTALLSELDLGSMLNHAQQRNRECWAFYEATKAKYEAHPKSKERADAIARSLAGLEPTDTLESLVAQAQPLTVFAVLKDGVWYERGKMAWFGHVVDPKGWEEWDAQVQLLLSGLSPDTRITIVDCHI